MTWQKDQIYSINNSYEKYRNKNESASSRERKQYGIKGKQPERNTVSLKGNIQYCKDITSF